MAKSTIEPLGDHVLVVDTQRRTTIDGIELPDNVRQQDMVFGLVVEVGAEVTYVKPQDTILYGPYAGKQVAFDGVQFRIMKQGSIEGRVKVTEG